MFLFNPVPLIDMLYTLSPDELQKHAGEFDRANQHLNSVIFWETALIRGSLFSKRIYFSLAKDYYHLHARDLSLFPKNILRQIRKREFPSGNAIVYSYGKKGFENVIDILEEDARTAYDESLNIERALVNLERSGIFRERWDRRSLNEAMLICAYVISEGKGPVDYARKLSGSGRVH